MGKQKRLPLIYYLLLLAAGAVYVVLALSDNIWADEAYTFAMLPHSFGEIWQITAADVHPPLYYFAAKLYIRASAACSREKGNSRYSATNSSPVFLLNSRVSWAPPMARMSQ